MEKILHDIQETSDALKGAAKGIAAAMDEGSINSDEIYNLLTVIASRLETIISI